MTMRPTSSAHRSLGRRLGLASLPAHLLLPLANLGGMSPNPPLPVPTVVAIKDPVETESNKEAELLVEKPADPA